ncbi:4Fe-4S binding protein [bacterium]|nr:4Fe-4S binding protein [bacterium]MBU1917792.1 4Fe-4S binding protein [bacterium]
MMKYLNNVVTLKLDEAKCVGCMECLEVCPRLVFEKYSSKIRIKDLDACIECGACALNCAPKALTVQPGVGCAAAIINSWFPQKKDSGCC